MASVRKGFRGIEGSMFSVSVKKPSSGKEHKHQVFSFLAEFKMLQNHCEEVKQYYMNYNSSAFCMCLHLHAEICRYLCSCSIFKFPSASHFFQSYIIQFCSCDVGTPWWLQGICWNEIKKSVSFVIENKTKRASQVLEMVIAKICDAYCEKQFSNAYRNLLGKVLM